jgi:Cdc6-like AAA superfamily ATPase
MKDLKIKVSLNKEENLVKQILLYAQQVHKNTSLSVFMEQNLIYGTIDTLKSSKYDNCVKEISLIPSNMPILNINKILSKQEKDKTGIYYVKLSFGDLYFARYSYARGYGTIVIAKYYTYLKFASFVKKINKTENIIAFNGFYSGYISPSGSLIYTAIDLKDINKTFHKNKDNVFEEINYFFNNIPLFTRFGLSGTRKLLLAGEPGTGKSSLLREIVNYYIKEKSILICSSINQVHHHYLNCIKYNLSGIAIFEDVESAFYEPTADILNFLDGYLQKKVPKGFLTLMTTNRIKYINPRILKRPGRIDKIFNIDILTNPLAFECAQYYFGKYYTLNPEFKNFNNKTGAQIKEIVFSTLMKANSQQVPINEGLIIEVIEEMKKLYQDIQTVDNINSDILKSGKSLGFA